MNNYVSHTNDKTSVNSAKSDLNYLNLKNHNEYFEDMGFQEINYRKDKNDNNITKNENINIEYIS